MATVGETTVGVQPRNDGLKKEGPTPRPFGEGSKATFGNEAGHAVVHGASVYSIYWDPGDLFHEHHEWLVKTDHFLQQMGAASGDLRTIFSSLAQYRDRSNAPAADSVVFKGSYHDFVKYPGAGCTDPKPLELGAITCLTDAQLREQLSSFIAGHGLPKGMNTIYYLITPPGVTVCLDAAGSHCSDFSVSEEEAENEERKSESWEDSFCSYHGAINPSKAAEGDANTVLYAAIPWTAGAEGSGAFTAGSTFYDDAFDCQDGGFMVENEEVVREAAKPLEKAEQEILNGEKGTPKEKFELEEKIRLESPHVQEPNQEGKGEFGDYSAGLADLTVNQIAEEQANIVTDPLLQSWKATGGYEVTDLCRNTFANTVGGPVEGSGVADKKTEAGEQSNESVGDSRYYINNVWSRSDQHCVGGVGFIPRFTAPNPVNAGETVGFNGMGSTVSLIEALAFGPSGPPSTTYATFTWNFGDGTEASGYAPGSPACEAPWLSPCAGSVFHAYTYGGNYPVTLTITDVAGDKTSLTETVTVAGPAAPSAGGPPASPGSSSGSSGSGSGAGSGSGSGAGTGRGATPPPGKPVATRGRDVAHAEQRPAQGPRDRLHRQRAGRRPLRGPDLAHAGPQAEDLRHARHRAAGRHSSPARDRQSVPRHDQGRAQRGAREVLEEDGGAAAPRPQRSADAEADRPQRLHRPTPKRPRSSAPRS